MEPNNFKLLLKKAIFTGNTFLRHTETIELAISDVMDEELVNLFETDQEAFELLDKWEEIRNKLVDLAIE